MYTPCESDFGAKSQCSYMQPHVQNMVYGEGYNNLDFEHVCYVVINHIYHTLQKYYYKYQNKKECIEYIGSEGPVPLSNGLAYYKL